MQALYYDRDGNPVGQQRWQQLGRQPDYRSVGYACGIRHGRLITVVTFWLGVAAETGPGGPLIFHTHASIRGPVGWRATYQRLWGWPSLEAARTGHQAVNAWIAEMAAFLAGHASQLPASGPALPGTTPSSAGERW
jgi:hypothetical protein